MVLLWCAFNKEPDSMKVSKKAIDTIEIPLPAPQYQAYNPGEKLEYSLKYAMITGAHATLEVKKDLTKINEEDHYHIYIDAKTNKFLDGIYMVRDKYESFINSHTLLPSLFNRDIKENNYIKKESYVFDQKLHRVKMEAKEDSITPRTFDIISGFYYLRSLNFNTMKKGTRLRVNTYFDKQFFPLGATYVGKSTVTTGLGTFKVKVFKPKLIEGRLFANQSDMTLYVSDDSNQVPIRIESAVYLDKVKADLVNFQHLKYKLSSKIK